MELSSPSPPGATACASTMSGTTRSKRATASRRVLFRSYNVMIFAGAVARFDRVVPDIVLAHAVAPGGEGDESSIDASATVQAQIQDAMEGYDLQVEVSSEQGTTSSNGGLLSLSGTFRTYTCTMHYEPWPSSLSIAGVSLGAPAVLTHERAVTVDPWRPGVVM